MFFFNEFWETKSLLGSTGLFSVSRPIFTELSSDWSRFFFRSKLSPVSFPCLWALFQGLRQYIGITATFVFNSFFNSLTRSLVLFSPDGPIEGKNPLWMTNSFLLVNLIFWPEPDDLFLKVPVAQSARGGGRYRIHRQYLCSECPGYDTKKSDSEVSVFGVFGVPLHCHRSQVYSVREW